MCKKYLLVLLLITATTINARPMSEDDAIRAAREEVGGGEVLSIDLIDPDDTFGFTDEDFSTFDESELYYVVKLLLRGGQVKVIKIPAEEDW